MCVSARLSCQVFLFGLCHRHQVCLLCQVTLCVFVCSQLCLQYQGSVGSDCCHVKASQPVVALSGIMQFAAPY